MYLFGSSQTWSWWTFRPRKKIFSPPPPEKFPNSLQTPSRPLGPSRPSPPPPLLGFSIKNRPPPPGASDSPFPLPEQKKIKNNRKMSTKLGSTLPTFRAGSFVTAGFLYRAGAETPLNFREKFRVFPERFWRISQGRIPKPQFWYPPLRFGSQHRIPKHLFFLVFWVSTADFGFPPGDENFRILFPEVPVVKIRVSAPAPYPPPRENITKIIRPEYFCVISGGGYGKIA